MDGGAHKTLLSPARVEARPWVTLTVPGDTTYGENYVKVLDSTNDPYASLEDGSMGDENPHHIYMSQKEADRGAVATWKRGAAAGRDDSEDGDDDDDNAPKYSVTVSVNPVDARRGAYVRYTRGAPPGTLPSDAAKAAAGAEAAAAAKEADRDAEPLLRPVQVGCSDANPLGLDPPPCAVVPAKHATADAGADSI